MSNRMNEILVAACLVVAGLGRVSGAQCPYDVTIIEPPDDLCDLGSALVRPLAISDAGTIVGYWTCPVGNSPFSHRNATRLIVPPGATSRYPTTCPESFSARAQLVVPPRVPRSSSPAGSVYEPAGGRKRKA